MKKSVGILVYRNNNGIIEVLLGHCGGPYKKNIDEGAWSLSKGEKEKNEKALTCAKRELKEEFGIIVENDIKYLVSKKISKKKLAIMFYVKQDFDISKCKSNTFTLEILKGSGNILEFFEMDKYNWYSISEAKNKIINNQIYFLNRFEKIIIK